MIVRMTKAVLTVVLAHLLLACADSGAVETPIEGGYYDVINSNEGLPYNTYCHDLACQEAQAVRLLQQYLAAGDGRSYRCNGTDKTSVCRDDAGHVHASVQSCDKQGLNWVCEMTAGEPAKELGTVLLAHPAYRFSFWDGAAGVGDTHTHALEILPGELSTFLPH